MRDFLSIDTPENVTFGYEVAGIGSRIVAYAIDFAIRWTPFLALLLVAFLAGFVVQDLGRLGTYLLVALGVGLFAIHVLYFIVCEALFRGQTPGKRIAGIRVVLENGRPASLAAVLARNLLRLVDLMPGGYGLAVVVMFVNSKAQRVGDLVAGTVVVKERSFSRRSVEELGYSLRELEDPSVELGVEVGHEEYELIQRYLHRYPGLVRERREPLGREVLEAVVAGQPEHVAAGVRAYAERAGTPAALREVALHFARDHR